MLLVGGQSHDTGDARRVVAVAVGHELEAHGPGDLDLVDQLGRKELAVGVGVVAIREDAEDNLQVTPLFVRDLAVDAREGADQPPERHPQERVVRGREVADGADVLGTCEGHEQGEVALDLDDHDGVLDARLRGLEVLEEAVQSVAQGGLVTMERGTPVHEYEVDDLLARLGHEGGDGAEEARLGLALGEADSCRGVSGGRSHDAPLCSFSVFPLLAVKVID